MSKRPSEVRIEQLPNTPESEDGEADDHHTEEGEGRRMSRENLMVGGKQERSMSLKSSAASSRSSLLQHSFEGASPLPDDSLEALDEDPETEVDVMERTSRFKISTDPPTSSSQKSSFERRPSYDGRISSGGDSEDRFRIEKRSNLEQSHQPNKVTNVGDGFIGTNRRKSVPVHEMSEPESSILKSTKGTKIGLSLDGEGHGGRKTELRWMSTSQSDQEESLLSKSRKLARYNADKSNTEVFHIDNRRFSVRSSTDGSKILNKRGRSKSVADQPSSNRTYSIAKSKINFKSAKAPKPEEPKLLGTSSKLFPIVQSSITFNSKGKETVHLISEQPYSSPTSEDTKFAPEGKKFSLSLDVLPNRRNSRSKLSRQGTPANSEDNLINIQSPPSSEVSSPKPSKKRSETSRNLIFSLLRRSPSAKEEDQSQNSL